MKRNLLIVVQALAFLLFTTAIGVSAAQRPESAQSITFTDVPTSNPFYENILHLTDATIVGGYNVENICGVGQTPCFKPFNNVTRGQIAKFVDNGRIRPGIAVSTTEETTPYDALPLSSKTGVSNGIAIYGEHTATTGSAPGVYGITDSGSGSAAGVLGVVNTASAGGYSAAVRGINHGTGNNGIGVYGSQDGHGWGVYGTTGDTGLGVYGLAGGVGTGVLGENDSTGIGVYGLVPSVSGGASKGVFGETRSGFGGYGVYANSTGFGYGVYAQSTGGFGVYGKINSTDSSGDAIHGYALPTGGNRYAGNFEGNVRVTGGSCTGCLLATYQLDDPRDPANKVINQAAVASSDYMNIYNGNVTTDAGGQATVSLPGYFELLNRDPRYQLTVVGDFAEAVVAQKVSGNKFVIKTNKPNVEVSWQVTGIRNDAVAKANPVTAEQDKSAAERGYYLNPELYGQPLSKAVGESRGMPKSDAQPDSVTPAQVQK